MKTQINDFVDISLNIFDEIPDTPEVYDELIAFAQEIWLCFNIKPNEMISDTKSGILSLQSVIFNRSISNKMTENLVKDEINNFTSLSSKFKYDVTVKFYRGKIKDIAVIDVIIYDTHDKTLAQRFIFK